MSDLRRQPAWVWAALACGLGFWLGAMAGVAAGVLWLARPDVPAAPAATGPAAREVKAPARPIKVNAAAKAQAPNRPLTPEDRFRLLEAGGAAPAELIVIFRHSPARSVGMLVRRGNPVPPGWEGDEEMRQVDGRLSMRERTLEAALAGGKEGDTAEVGR